MRYQDFSVRQKITLSMDAIIIVFILAVLGISSLVFSLFIKDDTFTTYSDMVENIQTRYTFNYNAILKTLISISTDSNFQVLVDKTFGNDASFYSLAIGFQPYIAQIENSSSLISHAAIIDKGGQTYSSFTSVPQKLTLPAQTFLLAKSGISIIPETTTGKSDSLILMVPVFRKTFETLSFSGSAEDFLYCFLLVFSKEQLINLISGNLHNADNIIYFYTGSDSVIGFSPTPTLFRKGLDAMRNKWQHPQTGKYFVYHLSAFNGVVDILLLIGQAKSHERFLQLAISLFVISSVLAVGAFILIKKTANILTKPIRSLTNIVAKISSGTYTVPEEFNGKDEISTLGNAINAMQTTITTQIGTIKEAEQEKYNLHVQLITEQIKPHFIYNTFEYINTEITNNHMKNASAMVLAFSEYLRLGLNNGLELSTLENEIEYSRAYVKIMNLRFNQYIAFTAQIPRQFLSFHLPKICIQPLVENSIRHGFPPDSILGAIDQPVITISFSLNGDTAMLVVSDNGVGIDVNKATEAMKNNTPSPHIGLSNIYRRFSLMFSDVTVSFRTNPFLQNDIIFSFKWAGNETREKPTNQ